ncbi:MAG: ParB/RepB/Spo0J family partition protein [Candidatus Omnitrophica bacterium]|nr:ParB/RepB/Spo0J family partition protein [Candidatus Omnitrophota bacterium]
MQRKVLGKGLSALMPEKPVKAGTNIVSLNIAEINLSKFQPRGEINPEKLEELVASIREKGVIQPVLVRPKKEGGYELIAGERRWHAAKRLKFTQLPAIVKDVEDAEALQLSLIENIQREDLNPLEEAKAYQRLIAEFGYTQEKIAQLVGKDPSSVSNTLRLLKLPKEIQDALLKGLISMGHARTILAITTLNEQTSVFKRIMTQRLSVRELESVVSKRLGQRKKHSRFKAGDPHLVALEEQMQHILGTKVKIIAGRKRGKIVLEYYSLNDLERLIKLLKSVK